jgi:hypothetical protein
MGAVKKYLHDLDLVRNKLLNPILNPLSTSQRITLGASLSALDEGYTTYDITLDAIYFWDGSAWITPTGGGGAVWGSITGTLTAQADLTAYLAANYYPLSSNPAGYLTAAVTSVATSAPITGGTITTTGTIGITQSGAATDGYLSSGNWTTFNNKVGGSGTTNFVPKFSNTGVPATIADSQIFDNGTSVGIGTITPSVSFKLDVVGSIRASAFGYFGNNDVRINTSSSGYVDFYDSTERKFLVGNGATDVASFRTYNGNIFQFDNNADFIPLQLARFSSQVFKSVGTDTHNVIQSSPIINATGGTTLVRGFYYDPNLTSTTGVTNVAFENANGDIIHRNLATGGADEMVTVDSTGKLKKQVIPTGSSVGFEMNFLLMGA